METENLVTKISQILPREDGTEVKIVATLMTGVGLHESIDVYVLRRQSPEHNWNLLNDRPHPDWRTMSLDEYVKHGRSEMLQAVSHGEILKLTSQLGKPLRQ